MTFPFHELSALDRSEICFLTCCFFTILNILLKPHWYIDHLNTIIASTATLVNPFLELSALDVFKNESAVSLLYVISYLNFTGIKATAFYTL